MSLELYIWGPAFGLTSIEPESIAAVAYLKSNVPIESWVLIPDHGLSSSRPGKLPYLCDGDVTAIGFEAIVSYLCKKHKAKDDDLTKEQKADCTAFKAHIRATALPLIDVHLYLSSENSYHITRPAWTAILPWYANYFTPPRRRAAAKARTEHLGLSGLDIDHDVSSSKTRPFRTIEERYENARAASLTGNAMARGSGSGSGSGIARANTVTKDTFPASAQPEGNIRDMLVGSGSPTLFKLDNLAAACFGPLEELLGDNQLLVSDENIGTKQPSSLDCLALGYLSLIAFPDMRKAFLADVLRTKYAKLYAYVLRLQDAIFGKQAVDVHAVMSLKDKMLSCKPHQSMASTNNGTDFDITLPWSSPKTQQPSYQTFKSTTINVIHSIPLLNSVLPHNVDNVTSSSEHSQDHSSVSLSSTSHNPSHPPSLFSSLFPLATAILTFFVSCATYAALSEKADINPHFKTERGLDWRQRHLQQQHSYDHGYNYGYKSVGTAIGLMRHGISGLHAGGIGKNVVPAREERGWGRSNATGGGADGAIAGDETEATIAEVEAEVKV